MIFPNGRVSGPPPAGGEQRGAGAPYLVWNPVPAAAQRPRWMPERAEPRALSHGRHACCAAQLGTGGAARPCQACPLACLGSDQEALGEGR